VCVCVCVCVILFRLSLLLSVARLFKPQTVILFVYLLHMRHLIFCFGIKCCHQNECCMEIPEIILIRDYLNSSLVMLVMCRIHMCICQ